MVPYNAPPLIYLWAILSQLAGKYSTDHWERCVHPDANFYILPHFTLIQRHAKSHTENNLKQSSWDFCKLFQTIIFLWNQVQFAAVGYKCLQNFAESCNHPQKWCNLISALKLHCFLRHLPWMLDAYGYSSMQLNATLEGNLL